MGVQAHGFGVDGDTWAQVEALRQVALVEVERARCAELNCH